MFNSSIESDTLTRPSTTDGGDHDKFAHYVRKNEITESAVTRFRFAASSRANFTTKKNKTKQPFARDKDLANRRGVTDS